MAAADGDLEEIRAAERIERRQLLQGLETSRECHQKVRRCSDHSILAPDHRQALL